MANSLMQAAHGSGTYPTLGRDFACEALRSVPAALLVVRGDGEILLANQRACDVLERTMEELQGAPVEAYLAPLERLLCPSDQDERSSRIRVSLPRSGASWIGFSTSSVDDPRCADREERYAIILKNITEVQRLREERDRLLQIATVHEILPSILHEVKNPLAAIAATTELLVEEATDEPVRRSAHAILREVRRMKLTLQGIGAVGRGLRASRPAAVDLAVCEAAAVLRAKAEAHGVVLSSTVADMPLLPFDPSVIAALVFNLVNNAVEATPAGGRVELSASLDAAGRGLELCVSDTGCGMPKEVLARCRDLFFTTKPKGSGIGLALCERAVREAGGTVDIVSAPNQGTTVTLLVPLVVSR